MQRPNILSIDSTDVFNTWYWDKNEMIEFCEHHRLSTQGTKANLRARIVHFLDAPGTPYIEPKNASSRKAFNWSKAELHFNTIITADIRFGPNVRNFFKAEIGSSFSCHGDFMNWVKHHPGATLGDAITAWKMLEARKHNPSFRRQIAPDNMMNRYIREYFDKIPDGSFQQALSCWKYKKHQPLIEGAVKFSMEDLSHSDPEDN